MIDGNLALKNNGELVNSSHLPGTSGYALDAIAGTGSGTDLVTHAIYLNKIMTITDLLDELENKGDLNVNIGSVAQDSEFVDGDPLLAKYIRSRNVLAKIRNLAMTFSK